MKPHEPYTNGDESDSPESDSEGCAGGVGGAGGAGWVEEAGLPARSLAALNALRKSRQHYDVLLLPGAGGEEVAAHSCVLGAISPQLLAALCPAPAPPAHPPAPPPHAAPPAPRSPPPPPALAAPLAYRVEGVDADSLRVLVEYAYSGRVELGGTRALRRLYVCAWRLRVEAVCRHVAAALLRRVSLAACLPARALPDLTHAERLQLDLYIQHNFSSIVSSGALSALPLLQASVVRGSSAEGGAEGGAVLCDAVLQWLTAQRDVPLGALCSRAHVLYIDGDGALQLVTQHDTHAACAEPLINRESPCAVEAVSRRDADGVVCVSSTREHTVAVLSARGTLLALRLAWRDDVPHTHGGGGIVRGGVIGSAEGRAAGEGRVVRGAGRGAGGGAGCAGGEEGEERACMEEERCAFAACEMDGELVVCGGYERSRVLQSCSTYSPARNAWLPRPPRLPAPRARLPAAALHGTLYVIGGSDGSHELSTVLLYNETEGGGAWRHGPPLPVALSQCGGCAGGGAVWGAGGWAGGRALRSVYYLLAGPGAGTAAGEAGGWRAAPPLRAARSQCACVAWGGALWALGGCDSWRCLSSTETLQLPDHVTSGEEGEATLEFGGGWEAGAALPSPRRSVAAAVWRDTIYAVGGSDGSNSLRSVLQLAAGAWRAAPALRTPRAAPAAAPLGGALYVAGGYSGKEFLSCVECLYSPDGEWTTLCSPPALRHPAPTPAPAPASPPALAASDQPKEKQNGSSEAEDQGDVEVKTEENTEEVKKMSECSLSESKVSPDSIGKSPDSNTISPVSNGGLTQ